MKPSIAVLILTKNEGIHIRRAIESVLSFAREVHIVDSYSTDSTLEIAEELGARVYQNPWTNHAVQVQWAIDNCDIGTKWIMRLDADEFVTEELSREIQARLSDLEQDITGIVLKRRLYFMGKWIRHGGYYPVKLLRVWRRGSAHIEQRLMDEHVVLTVGRAIEFKNDIVDENLNNLNWWTDKHNYYALREAVDALNQKYHFYEGRNIDATLRSGEQASKKRWFKSNVYLRLPILFRAIIYFNYRYWIQLGVLDGTKGLVWHFLQACWYRFLVDSIIYNIEHRAAKGGKPVEQIIKEDYNYMIAMPEVQAR